MAQTEMKNESSHSNGKIPYWMKAVVVFFLGWIAVYGTRTILNPIMSDIKMDFGLNNAQTGLIMTVFLIGYAGLNVPSGIMGDKYGKKRVLIPGVILFGIFAAITGTMPTFILFMGFWLMTGIFQGFYYGPQYGLSSEAIPKKNITVGSAVINSGMAFGTSIGYFISTYTVDVFNMNWRVPFFIMGAFVVIVGILMWWVVQDKPKTKEEREAEKASGDKLKISELFKNRNLVLAYIAIFCIIYGFFVILTWLPTYLEEARGVTGGAIALVSSLAPWASIPGALFFSWISDKTGRRSPVMLTQVLLSIICVIAIPFFESMAVLYVALIGYGVFGKLSTNPILTAIIADNAPTKGYGTSFGVYNFIGMCGSILAPYVTGLLTDITGTLDTGFYFAAVLLVIAAIATFFIKEDDKSYVAS